MPLNPTDLATLSRLLDEALDLEPGAINRWLAELPAKHVHLRDQLADMLKAHRSQSNAGFMADGPLGAVDETVASAGELVGPYRLIREIGRGGMGLVWLAERADGTLKRHIALKLPRLAWGTGLAERMARERDIGALLEHPNIARLYDAGVDTRGRPYLALEYIDGRPLDAWCESQGLSIRDRLKLFVQVARAVAYAHGRLVVHRDLKPSNVLVTADGQAHLLDFGIAKLLHEAAADDAQLTREQGRVLTPQYASPEQVAGEPITVQSDVYSLGVLLYEVLTGTLPIEPKRHSLGALEEAILQGDAPRASGRVDDRRTVKTLRGEVDAILAKAMQREPVRRYVTADAMAQDIERYLRGDTVSARPDSAAYRMRKAVRRHWAPIATAAAVLSTAAIGALISLSQAQMASREAERTRMVTLFVSDVLRLNAQAATAATEGQNGQPADVPEEPAAKLIEVRFAGEPELQAQMYGAVGRVYADLGIGKRAVYYSQRQVDTLARAHSDSQAQARARLLQADAWDRERNAPAALAEARHAVALVNADSPLGFEAASQVAELLWRNGQAEQAERELVRLSTSKWSDERRPSLGRARLLGLKGTLLLSKDRLDEGLPHLLAAISMAVSAEGGQSDWAARERFHVATMLIQSNRDEAGFSLYRQAMLDAQAGGDVARMRAAVQSARFWERVSWMHLRPHEEVMRALEAAALTLKDFGSRAPPEMSARVRLSMGVTYLAHGDVVAAHREMSSVIPLLKQSTNSVPDQFEFAEFFAPAAMATGHADEADAALRELHRWRHENGESNAPWAAYDWAMTAQNLLMQGRIDEAVRGLQLAPPFGNLQSQAGGGDIYAFIVPFARARSLVDQGDAGGALRILSSGHLPVLSDSDPNEHDNKTYLSIESVPGEVWCAAGRQENGLASLRAWIDAAAPHVSEADPGVARVRALAGLCALQLGRRGDAAHLAMLARGAFLRQGAISSYYKAPLRQLEGALGLKLPAV